MGDNGCGGRPPQELILIGNKFSKENQPKHDRKKAWSIRRSIKRLARSTLEIDENGKIEKVNEETFVRAFRAHDRKLTWAELVAARKFKDALAGNTKAQQQLEDSVDGKLVNKVMETSATLEELLTGDFKESDSDDEED